MKMNQSKIIPIIIIIIWYISCTFLGVPNYIIPSPYHLYLVMIDFIIGGYDLSAYSGEFVIHSVFSIGRVLIGFLIALCLGIPLGILTGWFQLFNKLIDPFVHIIRTVPGIGWLPIAMVWFGVGNKTTIFLIALAAFFPIYMNTVLGVKTIPCQIICTGKMLGAKGWVLLTSVIIPAAMTSLFSGMRLGLGVCWAYLVLGELTGVTKGLGAVMMDARMLGNIDMIMICMISIAFWGRITDKILVFIIDSYLPTKGENYYA